MSAAGLLGRKRAPAALAEDRAGAAARRLGTRAGHRGQSAARGGQPMCERRQERPRQTKPWGTDDLMQFCPGGCAEDEHPGNTKSERPARRAESRMGDVNAAACENDRRGNGDHTQQELLGIR